METSQLRKLLGPTGFGAATADATVDDGTPRWMTAAELSERYMVGEQTLLAYAARGDMPMFRTPAGTIHFDETRASRIFRPRAPAQDLQVAASDPRSLGVLGMTRLGSPPPASSRMLRSVQPVSPIRALHAPRQAGR